MFSIFSLETKAFDSVTASPFWVKTATWSPIFIPESKETTPGAVKCAP